MSAAKKGETLFKFTIPDQLVPFLHLFSRASTLAANDSSRFSPRKGDLILSNYSSWIVSLYRTSDTFSTTPKDGLSYLFFSLFRIILNPGLKFTRTFYTWQPNSTQPSSLRSSVQVPTNPTLLPRPLELHQQDVGTRK